MYLRRNYPSGGKRCQKVCRDNSGLERIGIPKNFLPTPWSPSALAAPSCGCPPALGHASPWALLILDMLPRSPYESASSLSFPLVQVFTPRFLLRLAVVRLLRLPEPHEPRRLPGFLCPRLTAA
jgi:hypothetical protein